MYWRRGNARKHGRADARDQARVLVGAHHRVCLAAACLSVRKDTRIVAAKTRLHHGEGRIFEYFELGRVCTNTPQIFQYRSYIEHIYGASKT